MDSLPAIDLGLMAEHLTAHEGVINKLSYYQSLVSNTELRNILKLQENVMHSHVWVMLAFINPNYHNNVEVPPLSVYREEHIFERPEKGENNKWIALEAHSTAKNMSVENYNSAMMMQNENVKNAHIKMALQQNRIGEKYTHFIKMMGWSYAPKATTQAQINTFLHFDHLLKQ
ncbi:hypothetical protein [Oceanobacillus massiliensis]|uniref:hypothetical protein n=1 Tax=Oceanobacillus massiliensis TaxID=1465765 RepID=UPI000288C0B2|nr:hypothetical protein [Oceanobacillus massiliensis]